MDPDDTVTPDNKRIARHVAAVFDGTPRVVEYRNDAGTRHVAVLSCADRPMPGLVSYSTIGLSDQAMPGPDGEFPVRIELAGVCMDDGGEFARTLASTAFTMMQHPTLFRPGMAIPYAVAQHRPTTHLPHLYLTAPFPWGDSLDTLPCATKTVTWLLAMPIGVAEYAYLQSHGDAAFERVLAEGAVDFANPNRAAVV